MGLWLKCPGCRANNPLSAQVCSHCGQSLENLAPNQRVYVLESAGITTREPSPAPAHRSEAAVPQAVAPAPVEAAAPAAKKPKRAKKKKA